MWIKIARPYDPDIIALPDVQPRHSTPEIANILTRFVTRNKYQQMYEIHVNRVFFGKELFRDFFRYGCDKVRGYGEWDE